MHREKKYSAETTPLFVTIGIVLQVQYIAIFEKKNR